MHSGGGALTLESPLGFSLRSFRFFLALADDHLIFLIVDIHDLLAIRVAAGHAKVGRGASRARRHAGQRWHLTETPQLTAGCGRDALLALPLGGRRLV